MVIMVVDDEPDTLQLMRVLLEKAGHRVEVANDASEALERIYSGEAQGRPRPDLIITDLKMPTISGQEFIDVLRALPGPTPPIIICSAYPETASRDEIVVAKPFQPADLIAAIDRALGY